jgi:hypothetical protein
MPDGDILRLGIPGQYCTVYQQLCEGVAPEACARALARGLRNRIHWYGEGPRELLKQMATEFIPLVHQVEPIQPQQLTQLDRTIARERRKLNGQQEGMNIATDVCKTVLHRLQHGEITDLNQELANLFIDQVLERSYDARVASVKEHFDDVPSDVIQERRQAADAYLVKHLDSFKKQVLCGASSQKMRLASKRRSKVDVDLDDIVE